MFRITLSRNFCAIKQVRLQHCVPTSLVTKRSYATHDANTNPKLLELMNQLQTNTKVVQKLHNFNSVVSKKGIAIDGSFANYVKIMNDDEIKNALHELILEMNEAGIKISSEVLEPVLKEMLKK